MGKIRIVTDSSAQFLDPSLVRRYGITVVPNTIQIGMERYREGIDLDSASFSRTLGSKPPGTTMRLLPPSVQDFSDTYAALHRETDKILSIHMSRGIIRTWEHAQQATHTLLGRCSISVIDSMSVSVGLGSLVEEAATMAEATDSIDHIAQQLRKRVQRLYAVFYTESFEHLQRAGLLSESHAMLGEMLGIKPFVTIEDGALVAIEKVRTRTQVLDNLVEFVAEFEPTDRLVILQNWPAPNDLTRQLQERLVTELGYPQPPVLAYHPSVAALLGPDTVGIIVYQPSGLA